MSFVTDIFFTNTFTYLLAVVLSICVIIYIWGKWHHDVFRKMGIPGPIPLPFVGHVMAMARVGNLQFNIQTIKKYGNYVGVYFGPVPTLLINDVDVAKQVMVKEAGSFTDRISIVQQSYPMRRTMTALKGEEWKRVRSFLSPTFTSGKLKKMTPLMGDAVERLTNRFAKAADDKEDIDVKSYFGGLTMDVIARTMFGLEVKSQEDPNNIFLVMARRLFMFNLGSIKLLIQIAFPLLGKLMNKLGLEALFPKDVTKFFVDTVSSAIKERKDSGQKYHDFLALMMKANEIHDEHVASETEKTATDSTTRGLSEEEILAQAIIFMVAGYETTASTLQFLSYFLSKHPEIQEKCRQEIQREVGDEELDYDSASRLQYIEQCILETLRLCPPAVRIDRVCTEATTLTLDGREVEIPKGMAISFPIYSFQHDPDVWESPDTFDPNRFSQENRERRNPFYFMPFGMGPRNCIGMRFALLEMKLAVASVIRRVQFVPCEKTMEHLEFSKVGLLAPISPIYVQAKLCDAAA